MMAWFQSFIVRLAARLAPSLNKLLSTGGGTIERVEMELMQLRERDDARRRRNREEAQELREAIEVIGPQWSPGVHRLSTKTAESLKEAGAPAAVVKCYERLWELELALEDRGWVRELTLSNFEFSLFGIHRIIALCRLYFIKNPLIRRGIEVCSFYVFGRGVTISSDDDTENEVLQSFFLNPRNQAEIGHRALVKKDNARWTDGNLYFVFFRDKLTGDLLVRSLDPIEVVEIISDPDDATIERYIHRRWMSQRFDPAAGVHKPTPEEAWYPALGWDPENGVDRPDAISGVPVRWDNPVLHAKDGDMARWQFGVPLAYPAIDYARSVRRLIDNWCSIQEAMARFSWQVETQGGLPAIANLKQNFATTLAIGDGTMYEQNPPPTTAAAWISGPGNKLTMSKTSGMIDSPEVGRRVAHMVYMVFGLPETFFADASVGTVATATSLDRPTELKFMEAQEWWRELLQRIGSFVINESAMAPQGKIREARKSKAAEANYAPTIKVVFPSILEHDLKDQISAIVEAATLNGFECTGIDQRVAIGLLLQELQVEDWQSVLELMYPENEYNADLVNRNPLVKKENEMALNPPVPPANAGGVPPTGPAPRTATAKREAFDAAKLARVVASLEKASKVLKERMAA